MCTLHYAACEFLRISYHLPVSYQLTFSQQKSSLGLHGKVLIAIKGYRGEFCEKLLEASTMSDRASAIRPQDGPGTGQGRVHQQQR